MHIKHRQNKAKNRQENLLRKSTQHCTFTSIFSCPLKVIMFVAYVCVSKNDGTQALSPQLDAMREAGVESNWIYSLPERS
jgi:hypothetical protein